MAKRNTTIKITLSAIALALILLLVYLFCELNSSADYDSEIEIYIPKNTSIEGSIEIINQKGLLEPKWLYVITAKIYSKIESKVIFAGYYTLLPGKTNFELLKALFSSDNLNTRRMTFPEGITIEKFAEMLKEKAGINNIEFLRLAYSDSLLTAHSISAESAEGYLMPDTYDFYYDQSPASALNKLLEAQDNIWKGEYTERAIAIDMSRHQVLTLASIIEAETPVVDERAKVSGVYHNRLDENWNLQADPTVQYGLGNKKKLSRRDLSDNNLYNTYIHKGLPPGPINCPSRSSIEAALYPDNHEFMYFVAVGDGSGRHNFAKTFTQHNIYKSEYKRNRRKQ